MPRNSEPHRCQVNDFAMTIVWFGKTYITSTESNFLKIKTLTNSLARGRNCTFNSSTTNVWCPGRELQIKNGLKKRLSKKKKAKNVRNVVKDEKMKNKRKEILSLVLKRDHWIPPWLLNSVSLEKEKEKQEKLVKLKTKKLQLQRFIWIEKPSFTWIRVQNLVLDSKIENKVDKNNKRLTNLLTNHMILQWIICEWYR